MTMGTSTVERWPAWCLATGPREASSHPAINKELARRLDALTGEMRTSQNPRQATDKHHLVVLDMAVLVESDLGRLPDGRGYTEVVVVEAGRETRLERLVGRGMTVGDARARMASQAGDAERRAVADHVVVNDGDEAQLAGEVDRLFDQLATGPVTSEERPAPGRCTPPMADATSSASPHWDRLVMTIGRSRSDTCFTTEIPVP